MNGMMIVETRDPFASREVEWTAGLLEAMLGAGGKCTLMLTENAVFGVRDGAVSPCFARLAEAGVDLLAERFALRERGIAEDSLAGGISSVELDVVIDRLAAGDRVVWR